jgi:hypothetical protein
MIDVGRLGVEACSTVGALDSGIGLAEILVGLRRQVFEEIMTPQTGLGQTLKATTGIRTDKLARSVLKLVWVLGGHVVL